MDFQQTPSTAKPPWLKVNFPSHKDFFQVSNLLKKQHLSTICQSAKCPNVVECWSHKTATFLILGDTCTRQCAFCAVKKGLPALGEDDEAQRVAEAVFSLGLRYAVITSVTRDDLPDGGASGFSSSILAIREKSPSVKIEVLIPDFSGNIPALDKVLSAQPDVLNHNLEVPEALYPLINRPKENYQRSLKILQRAKKMGARTKSGLMVGLGETENGLLRTFNDLKKVSCDLLTIGQYLQPSKAHVKVKKYYTPREFNRLRITALDFGLKEVESGPLVRSSYQAQAMYDSLQNHIVQ